MRWSHDFTNSMDMNLSRFWVLMMAREAWHAAVWAHKELDMTERLN